MSGVLTHILLDLDGTLVDSAPGILGSLRAAFDELGIDHDPAVLDERLLGPPLYESLPPIVGARAAEAVMPVYRRIYSEEGGLNRSTAYPGADDLLRALTGAGVTVALATSKAEVSAHKILANQGWTELFTEIVGDTRDAARPTKAHVVGEALARLGHPGGADAPLMVGDRSHDVIGARAHGLDCHGAGWGYGQPGELVDAGAVAVHASAADLRAALLD